MGNFFRNISAIICASVISMVATSAQVVNSAVSFNEAATVDGPKPYFVFDLVDGCLSSDGNAITNAFIRDNVVLRDVENPEVVYPILANVEGSRVTIFTRDMDYFESNVSLSVEFPALSDADENVYPAESFDVSTGDFLVITESTESHNIEGAQNILLKPGVRLTVDNNFICRNIVSCAGKDDVAGAGIRVLEGSTCTVMDTAYYLTERQDLRHLPYLINLGTYNAGGSIFMREVSNTYRNSYAEAYSHWYKNDPKQGIDDPYYRIYPLLSLPIHELPKNFLFYNTTVSGLKAAIRGSYLKPAFYYYNGAEIDGEPLTNSSINDLKLVFNSKVGKTEANYAVFRFAGDVNDEESYTTIVEPINANKFETTKFFDNEYPASINWRNVFENERISDPLCVHQFQYAGLHDATSVYNFKSGLTTFDGPIQEGYLQPQMTPAYFSENYKAGFEVTITKQDLATAEDVVEQYPDPVEVPYVRFAVEDPDHPKELGHRNVFAIYFIDSEEYMDAQSLGADGFNPTYNLNFLYDAPFTKEVDCSFAGAIFPYAGLKMEGGYENMPVSIKSLAYPYVNDYLSRFVHVYNEPLADHFKISVLDYGNLGNIGIQLDKISLNMSAVFDVTEAIVDMHDNEYNLITDLKFSGQSTYICELPIHYVLQDVIIDPGIITASEQLFADIGIRQKERVLTVNSRRPVLCSLYSPTGLLVSQFTLDGERQIECARGLYILHIRDGDISATRQLLIH